MQRIHPIHWEVQVDLRRPTRAQYRIALSLEKDTSRFASFIQTCFCKIAYAKRQYHGKFLQAESLVLASNLIVTRLLQFVQEKIRNYSTNLEKISSLSKIIAKNCFTNFKNGLIL